MRGSPPQLRCNQGKSLTLYRLLLLVSTTLYRWNLNSQLTGLNCQKIFAIKYIYVLIFAVSSLNVAD
jgi:hypothetical protein